jgi:endonuclease G, mitochondrial
MLPVDLLKEMLEKEYPNLFSLSKNINSVGIAYKEKNGLQTDQLCIRFSVPKKAVLDDLKTNKISPIPSELTYLGQRIAVDVVERVFPPIQKATTVVNKRIGKINPIQPGISISGEGIWPGTIGLIVKDKTNQAPMVLSNWHVLKGTSGTTPNNVQQPSAIDWQGSPSAILIGNFKRHHLGLNGDCAISSIDAQKRGIDTTIYDLAIKPKSILSNQAIALRMKVVKSGRTTGVTFGEINAINLKITYNYAVGAVMMNTFEIKANASKQNKPQGNLVCDSGDSGSAWLIDAQQTNGTVVGLHCGHSEAGPVRYANACYIDAVFKALNIDLYV